ncbi:MAG: hypothetical protein HIU84_07070 [Acidobacteria bacterium]|nr:hypothetical protein [Acidobacteriota bacterium]
MSHTDHTQTNAPEQHQAGGHGGHSWMMIACCIPMILIAVVLVATGVVSPGFLLYAVGCLGMMFVMMKMMDRGGMKM